MKLIALVCHIERFSKSGIPNYNSEVPDTSGKKTKRRERRRKKTIAMRYVFHTNTKNSSMADFFLRI